VAEYHAAEYTCLLRSARGGGEASEELLPWLPKLNAAERLRGDFFDIHRNSLGLDRFESIADAMTQVPFSSRAEPSLRLPS